MLLDESRASPLRASFGCETVRSDLYAATKVDHEPSHKSSAVASKLAPLWLLRMILSAGGSSPPPCSRRTWPLALSLVWPCLPWMAQGVRRRDRSHATKPSREPDGKTFRLALRVHSTAGSWRHEPGTPEPDPIHFSIFGILKNLIERHAEEYEICQGNLPDKRHREGGRVRRASRPD
jgi:hypothetical protein